MRLVSTSWAMVAHVHRKLWRLIPRLPASAEELFVV
jgi:hypothetical protein